MQRTLFNALSGALLLLIVSSAHAETADADGWKGRGELGLAAAKGNSDSQTLVGKINLDRESEKTKYGLGASLLYGKSDDIESAYRYEIFGTLGYRLGERSYLFGSLRNERDHFAANEYQWTAAGGYGYEAIRSERTQLTLEAGPGYRWSKWQDERVHANEVILRGYLDFSHKLTDTASLYDTLLIEAGADNTFARNDFGVQVAISDALALKAGLEVRHNTDVVPGTKKTDSLTTVNLVYGF